MNTKIFFIVLAAVLVVSFAVVLAIGRSDHGMGPRFGGPPMVMLPEGPASMVKTNSQGVFVMAGPKLVKYSADGLKSKSELKLEVPTVSKDAMQAPPLPAMFDTVKSSAGVESVLILTGNQLLVVDPAALKITQKIALPSPPTPAKPAIAPMGNMPGGPPDGMPGMPMGPGGPGQGMPGMGPVGPGMPGMPGMGGPGGPGIHGPGQPPSGFTVSGDSVYLIRGPQLLEVNYVTGKIAGKIELPLAK